MSESPEETKSKAGPPDEEEASPLSQRLRAKVKSEPPPPVLAFTDREAMAKKRLNSVLKGWRLTRLLGVGPVTAAYLAHRGAKDAREQAVLKLAVGMPMQERARSLFLRACYASNRFNHSRIMRVIEDGVDDTGAPFVVRAWADAIPLFDSVKVERYDEVSVLRLGEQVLDALEMAHAHGILHGAVTPANVLVTPRRSIRLCDFATPPGLAGTRTKEDDVLGRLRIGPFTAPERCAEGHEGPATETTDVYGVAACMYFAITKVPPRGERMVGPADLAHTPARPLRELAPHVGEAFASIIDHALSRSHRPLRERVRHAGRRASGDGREKAQALRRRRPGALAQHRRDGSFEPAHAFLVGPRSGHAGRQPAELDAASPERVARKSHPRLRHRAPRRHRHLRGREREAPRRRRQLYRRDEGESEARAFEVSRGVTSEIGGRRWEVCDG